MPGGFGGRSGVMALAGALHGEFVVTAADGSTQTERLQNGTVAAVSAGSLTVTSSDSFSATYVIGTDVDVSTIAVGDTVRVVATVNGSTVTATSVQSGTAGAGAGGAGPGGRPGDGDGMAPPDAQGAPQTS